VRDAQHKGVAGDEMGREVPGMVLASGLVMDHRGIAEEVGIAGAAGVEDIVDAGEEHNRLAGAVGGECCSSEMEGRERDFVDAVGIAAEEGTADVEVGDRHSAAEAGRVDHHRSNLDLTW